MLNPNLTTPDPQRKMREETAKRLGIKMPTTPTIPKPDYTGLEDRGGTIYAGEKGFKTPEELGQHLGIQPDKIDWGQISKQQLTSTITPITPTVPTTPTAPTAEQQLKAMQDRLLGTLTPGEEEIALGGRQADVEKQLADLAAATQKGILGVEGQGRGITTELVRGEQEKRLRQAGIAALPLSAQLANIQAKLKSKQTQRMAAADVESARLGFETKRQERVTKAAETEAKKSEPFQMGNSLLRINPETHEVEELYKVDDTNITTNISEFNLVKEQGFEGGFLDFLAEKKKREDIDSLSNAYEGLDASQQLQAGNLSVKIFGKRAGAKPENISKVTTLMKEGKTVDNIEDMLKYAGQSEKFSGDIRDAAESIASNFTSDAKRQQLFDSLDRSLETGDIERVKTLLKKSAVDSLGTDDAKVVRGKARTVEFLEEIRNDLSEYERMGGKTNIFAGTAEEVAKKIGTVRDAELRRISTKIMTAIQSYRRSMSGVAFSVPESKEYQAMFPSIGQTKDFNTANINALQEVFTGDLEFTYKFLMGDVYDDIFKEGSLDIQSLEDYIRQNPDMIDQAEQALNSIPDLTDDELLEYLQGFSSVGDDTKQVSGTGMRTDRHNNPTAMTTDVAKMALIEGVDYISGDPFPSNPNLKTAKFLKNPVDTTIKVIDRIGFFTGGGSQRWSHTAMSNDEWNRLNDQQKKDVVKKMYQREGNRGELNQFFV